MHGLSIGKLAKAAGVSIYTIRFYEKSGLLPQPARRPSGFRKYSAQDVVQLKFVRNARSLGFSLEDITRLLALEDKSSTLLVTSAIEREVAAIDRKIAALQRWRHGLCEWESKSAETRGSMPHCFLELETIDSDADVPAVAEHRDHDAARRYGHPAHAPEDRPIQKARPGPADQHIGSG